MFNRRSLHSTLIDAIIPGQGLWSHLLVVLSFSLLTALCAQISVPVPFSPVPITGQTFAVLLSGLLLGGRKAALSQALYLLEGMVGLPVFNPVGPPGLARLLGPTGGYLLSCPIAAWVVGCFAESGWSRSPLKIAISLVAGECVIYAVGLPWLAGVLRKSWLDALPIGLYPFLIGDAVKMAFIVLSLPAGWSMIGKNDRNR